MDGIAVGAGNWRANSEITLRHPAAAGPQSFGRQRRLPACWG